MRAPFQAKQIEAKRRISKWNSFVMNRKVFVGHYHQPSKGFKCTEQPGFEELDQTIDAVDLEATRCLIVTGAGDKSFVAGADIAEMSNLTKAEGEAFGKKGNDVFRKLETFPIPVIAAVNGFALGGGCELSMSCDIRICSENAMFGQPEAGLGITPGFGGTQRLARTIGVGKAKEMDLWSKNIKADEAYRLGLVNAVYPQEELMAAAEKMAAGISKNAPIAVRNCKKAINDGLQVDMDQAIVIEEKLFGDCFETADQKEEWSIP